MNWLKDTLSNAKLLTVLAAAGLVAVSVYGWNALNDDSTESDSQEVSSTTNTETEAQNVSNDETTTYSNSTTTTTENSTDSTNSTAE